MNSIFFISPHDQPHKDIFISFKRPNQKTSPSTQPRISSQENIATTKFWWKSNITLLFSKYRTDLALFPANRGPSNGTKSDRFSGGRVELANQVVSLTTLQPPFVATQSKGHYLQRALVDNARLAPSPSSLRFSLLHMQQHLSPFYFAQTRGMPNGVTTSFSLHWPFRNLNKIRELFAATADDFEFPLVCLHESTRRDRAIR